MEALMVYCQSTVPNACCKSDTSASDMRYPYRFGLVVWNMGRFSLGRIPLVALVTYPVIFLSTSLRNWYSQ